jgi:hypothetical protein
MVTPHSTPPTPLERAARAAYTRPDSSIPFERRRPSRQAYWRDVAERAVKAAVRTNELAAVIAAHTWDLDHETEHYRCSCGEFYVSDPVADHAEHLALLIRLTILAPHLLIRSTDEETNR